MTYSAFDEAAMRRALELAARGLYSTQPNPRVGAVLALDGEIVGEGWHEYAGGPHAEPRALEAAGGRARGATAYVTLEPCSHHGRTPPCVDGLLAAGVRRVVYAVGDPDPRVNGRGARLLRTAGVQVESGLLAAGLVDEWIVYVAPKLLGKDARPLAAVPRLARLRDAPEFELRESVAVGNDVRLRLRPKRKH